MCASPGCRPRLLPNLLPARRLRAVAEAVSPSPRTDKCSGSGGGVGGGERCVFESREVE